MMITVRKKYRNRSNNKNRKKTTQHESSITFTSTKSIRLKGPQKFFYFIQIVVKGRVHTKHYKSKL